MDDLSKDYHHYGESDGRDGLAPKEPNNPLYMKGWLRGILYYEQSFVSQAEL